MCIVHEQHPFCDGRTVKGQCNEVMYEKRVSEQDILSPTFDITAQ